MTKKFRGRRGRRRGGGNVVGQLLRLAVVLALVFALAPALRTDFLKLLRTVGIVIVFIGGIVIVLSIPFLLWIRKRRRKAPLKKECAPSDSERESVTDRDANAKGVAGENRVAERLHQGLPSDTYLTIRDVYLPVDGATTQIDEIVVSTFGVFIVEVKNYSGWILANDRPEWIQSMRGGKKFRFQNPIRQNYRHRCVLAECTGVPLALIESVVVFAGSAVFKGDLKEHPEKYPGVIHAEEAADYIRSFTTSRIKPVQVPEIVEAIREWQASISQDVIDAHVANLRRRHQASEG